jgi:hypothetical protein
MDTNEVEVVLESFEFVPLDTSDRVEVRRPKPLNN